MIPNSQHPEHLIYKIPHRALVQALETALCDLCDTLLKLAVDYPEIPLDDVTSARFANALSALSAVTSSPLQITAAEDTIDERRTDPC